MITCLHRHSAAQVLIGQPSRRAPARCPLDETQLQQAEAKMSAKIDAIAKAEGLEITSRSLARFEPVAFDPDMIGLVKNTAEGLGLSVKSMPSGAGHDAGLIAAIT